MQNLQEFLLTTKGNEYIIAVVFLLTFVLFWKLLSVTSYRPVRESLGRVSRFIKEIFSHPSHTWAEVVEPNLVNVGMDRFTSSVFGSIKEIQVPREGHRIYQGGGVWKIKRGERELVQISPVSGRVVQVNKEFLKNPSLLNSQNPEKNWILRIETTRLARELRNLLTGETRARWNQAVKEQLVATLVPTDYPVLQEGGEIKPDLGDELTSEQWSKVAREFFNVR